MKTIRYGTFETNSSSCHSITFDNSGKTNTNGIKNLIAAAYGGYCGSNNVCFDPEEGYSYDAGAPLPDPQSKFDYALVCYVEYLNCRAMHDDKRAWYNMHKKIKDKYSPRRIPLPESVYNKLCNEYSQTKLNLITGFKQKGIDIDWRIPDPNNLHEINNHKSWSGEVWISDFIDIDGYIDHSSSCHEYNQNAWKLAKMCGNPDELYDFIFKSTNEIIIQYMG